MDNETKQLVQESWAKVVPISDQAAKLFYDRLFQVDPTLKFLFKAPIDVQGKLLMTALDGAVKGLDDLDALVPVLKKLGARHAQYGVADKDYDTVGASFLWTLEQGLGEAFTPPVKEAWTKVYGVLATVMKEAQAEVHVAGPLSPRTRRLVQGSWKAVEPIADDAAKIFYQKLFELDATLKPLFKSDPAEQRKKLMQMLGTAVAGLDKLDGIVPAVKALGSRHTDYGVKDEDYDTVGAALLATLREGLGDAFTYEVEGAWTEVYTLLADTMKAAAQEKLSGGKPEKAKSGAGSMVVAGLLVVLVLVAFVAESF